MCIIHRGMAYAIHIDIFILMLLITCHNTWTELQPASVDVNLWKCMRMRVEMMVVVLYLSIIRLVHTQRLFRAAKRCLCGRKLVSV